MREICPLIVHLIIHSAMVGVGSSYTDGLNPESDCKLQAVYYLKVAGGFLLTLDILEILFHCFFGSKNENDNNGPICGLVNVVGCFVIFIWGSIIVFGPYQDWKYREADRQSENYCVYTPYMLSFVMRISGWCLTALCLILSCLELYLCRS